MIKASAKIVRPALAAITGVLAALTVSPAVGVAQARPYKHVCGRVNPHFLRCQADVVTNSSGVPAATTGPTGYNPTDLLSAYALTSAAAGNGSGQTVAIVDAYDDPNAESDLGVYRSHFGLPACTTANGCFHKVNQTGGTSYPNGNASWGQEVSLDLDMVSATCPNCHILLVEANSNSGADLYTAENEAATLGATQVSNSWSGGEYSGETSDSSTYFNHPGLAITVAAGDNGYGTQFPTSSQYVTAVGGTTLTRDSSSTRGWDETTWSGTGSGCSSYIAKPSWQTDSGCNHRTEVDVSADADPNTGVSVYDTYPSGGWLVFGGTSVASPIIASYYALVGSAAADSGQFPYLHPSRFNDITSGNDGSCSPSYFCAAGPGYDGPTGWGTPNGTTFEPSVTTGTASSVGNSSATIAGTVNPLGQTTTYHFDYGTSTNYGSQAPVSPYPSAGSGMTSQTVSTTLTALSQSTLYHYRIEATNASGTSYGADQTFRTTGLSVSPSSVSAGSRVTFSWNGVPNPTTHDVIGVYHPGDPNTSYVYWFWASSCTQTIGSTALASGSCTFTVPNQGLQPGTYELRLFSGNSSNNTYPLVFTSNSVSAT